MIFMRQPVRMFIVCWALLCTTTLHAQVPSSYGTEFVVAIPPNDNQAAPTQALHIMISSPIDTEVAIYDYDRASMKTRAVKANVPLVLRDDNGGTAWGSEVWEAEFAVPKALRISSQTPIAVWVLNSKVVSSDGYLARPLTAWGREYRVMSYYDFNEARPWAGGFMIVANEQTSVRILLQGTDNGARTSGGKKIGDEINVLLQEGEVYLVMGDGSTRGSFDLSGTRIVADRSIGVIGFHHRTTMPNLLIGGNGRNHMSEMLPPVSAFGTAFTTLEFGRVRSNGQGSGDVFRIVASEDATRWSCSFYDKKTGNLLGKQGGVLPRAGDVADISQTQLPTALVQGLAFWEMDKPCLLMQYSCSASFDGDANLDPMMVNVLPDATWSSSAVAISARAEHFTQHQLAMLFRTNINHPGYADNLASIRANGSGLFVKHVRDNVHVLEMTLPTGQPTPDWQGQYTIIANEFVTMSGTVYGNSFVDAYGWSVAWGLPAPTTSAGKDPMLSGNTSNVWLNSDKSIIHIDLPEAIPSATIRICDLLGRTVYHRITNGTSYIEIPVDPHMTDLVVVGIESGPKCVYQTLVLGR